jgi:ubiquinone/menaquinone biosynthesis C-methylase UbiE
MKDKKQQTIEQFDAWAKGYEEGLWGHYFSKSNKYIYSLLMRELPQNADLLDVGCGTGGLLALAAEHFRGNIIGLDLSSEMIRFAQEKNKDKEVQFIHADVEEADLRDQQFNAIICMNSFHHYQDHKCVVKKMIHHLKRGGVFILLDPITDNYLRKIWVNLLNNMFKETDVKYFSKKELNNMMIDEGFRIKGQKPFMYFALLSVYEKEL